MRLNKFLATHTDLSRRGADKAIDSKRVSINNETAPLGTNVTSEDVIKLDGNIVIAHDTETVTILLNKPVGYVCSKDGQGSKTVYGLLPDTYKNLNIAGRLDKDSSGLVILTNDGTLLNDLTHPSKNKEKIYEVEIDRELSEAELKKLTSGVDIGDERPSKFKNIEKIESKKYKVILAEGRNRQIRRSFEAQKCKVTNLRRVQLAAYNLDDIQAMKYIEV